MTQSHVNTNLIGVRVVFDTTYPSGGSRTDQGQVVSMAYNQKGGFRIMIVDDLGVFHARYSVDVKLMLFPSPDGGVQTSLGDPIGMPTGFRTRPDLEAPAPESPGVSQSAFAQTDDAPVGNPDGSSAQAGNAD